MEHGKYLEKTRYTFKTKHFNKYSISEDFSIQDMNYSNNLTVGI